MSSKHSDSEEESDNEQFKIISNEIAYFKSSIDNIKDTLSSHDPVIQEFLAFSDKRNKPLAKKTPLINNLKDQIRNEILEDVLRQFSGPLNKINLLEKQIDHFKSDQDFLHSEIEKDFSLLQSKTSTHEEQIALIKDGCSKINNHISNVYQELNSKATVEDVCKLQEIVPTLAPMVDVEQLREKTETLASKLWVEDVDKRLRRLQVQVNELPTMEYLTKQLHDLEDNINRYIARFAEKELVNSVADNFTDRHTGLEHRIESIKTKLVQEDELLSRRIAEVHYALDKEPWQKDVKELMEIIDTKALQCDLVSFREITFPKLEHFENRVSEFSAEIRRFEQALARFDEIILSKGSKHDIELIQKEMLTFVDRVEFSKNLDYVNAHVNRLNDFSQSSSDSIDKIVKDLDTYAISSKAQMKKNREISKLTSTVEEIKENLKSKAEKTETFLILQTMASKDDLNTLQIRHENLYADFEQSLVLQTETIKSMLDSAEAPVRKNKVREELYNSATCLMNTHLGLRARTLSRSPRNSKTSSGRFINLLGSDSLHNSGNLKRDKPHVYFLRSGLRKRKSVGTRQSLGTPDLKKF